MPIDGAEVGVWEPQLLHVGRRIDGLESDLERAICETLYRAPRQRAWRWLLTALLGVKHTLRGVLFSWPLYLLGVAALVLPQGSSAWLALFLLPGIALSVLILCRGIAEDYQRFIHRVLLKPGAARHILWPDT